MHQTEELRKEVSKEVATKNAYQQANEDIATLIAEVKTRKKWLDKDVGSVMNIRDLTLQYHRSQGTFPNMSFRKILLLADVGGYDIKFVKRETYG